MNHDSLAYMHISTNMYYNNIVHIYVFNEKNSWINNKIKIVK